MEQRTIAEIGVCTLIILVCVVILWQAAGLPPGSFEPLGSAPVPQATAGIVILCCLIVIVKAVAQIRRHPPLRRHVRDELSGRSPWNAIVMFGGTLAYVGLLQIGLLSFGLLTFVFLLLLIMTLNRFSKRSLLPASITAALFGFGLEYLFTRVFVVDLPV
ncbi:tripartite tricarboxylate transporter TctB family protein [Granulosicoccus sp. 3-233]|uniref:tripartite tricarboxylate transporter TctB family protein n=1 Tax=Granulosicoccus sp. 3-233 TaxID=3417969 RepID=UPI003D34C8E4